MICNWQEQIDIRKSPLRLEEASEIMVAGQWVQITATPCHLGGQRYWFLCPGCGRRCAILYPQRCRICIKGRYWSELLTPDRRKVDKAVQWRRALGQDRDGTLARFPPKPPRMRWHTWQRLHARSRALEAEIWAEGAVIVARMKRPGGMRPSPDGAHIPAPKTAPKTHRTKTPKHPPTAPLYPAPPKALPCPKGDAMPLTRLARRLWPEAPAAAPALSLPLPAQSLGVIPDLHGRADLLGALLARLTARDPQARLVFLGDLIDRGPDSLTVLIRVRDLCQTAPDRVSCLLGNHERMLLDFLADPALHGARWWASGGEATLAAMGIAPIHSRDPAARMHDLATRLRTALPQGMADWLDGLPLLWREGDLVLTHAGLDPALALEDQTEAGLLWGRHQGKYQGLRADGLWSVQGHQIVKEPRLDPGRVRLDLGAWRSGRLAGLWLDPQDMAWEIVTD